MARNSSLAVLVCACALLLGCGRTVSHDDEPSASDRDVDGGVEGSGSSGRGSNNGRDDDVGSTGSGSSAGRAGSSGTAGAPRPGATAGAGAPNPSGTGATGGSAQPPPIGSAGVGPGASEGPANPGATGILNPQSCATDEPFVLSIDPGGTSGSVRGWLESAPAVMFDSSGLPRFGSGFDVEGSGALMLWWSIASLGPPGEDTPDESSLYVYTLNAETELVALTARSPAEIGDAKALSYTGWNGGLMSVGPVKIMEITVLHHIPTDRYLAMQVLDVFGADDLMRRSECAAIEARWMMAPEGTGDFSGFE